VAPQAAEEEDQTETMSEVAGQRASSLEAATTTGDVPVPYTTCGDDHLGIQSLTTTEFPGQHDPPDIHTQMHHTDERGLALSVVGSGGGAYGEHHGDV
jgi:hypothetical protein